MFQFFMTIHNNFLTSLYWLNTKCSHICSYHFSLSSQTTVTISIKQSQFFFCLSKKHPIDLQSTGISLSNLSAVQTGSIHQSLSWQVPSHLDSSQIPCLLWNTFGKRKESTFYCVHKKLSIDPTLIQMNPYTLLI